MKLGVAWRNIKNYVKHDLKEIAFPSAMPNPPSFKPKLYRKLTLRDFFEIVRKSTTLYAKSWTRAGISKEEWKELGLVEEDDPEVVQKKEPDEPSSVEEIALAARAGAEHIRPALQRLYMTRATAYRDALKSFVEGYQEGIAEVLAEKKKPTEHPGSTEAKVKVTERHNVHTSNSKP
ncbi:hypothetical protein CY35_13G028400 [Sphagnum magellanicum]|jgi:hypothetical protein|nr:hypothetical protein CY35_13G028400 [Sphagnum magellanicum]KAH9542842.1 hypothetical protein CY35_13G028400 [Sphagnum magellanicum]